MGYFGFGYAQYVSKTNGVGVGIGGKVAVTAMVDLIFTSRKQPLPLYLKLKERVRKLSVL